MNNILKKQIKDYLIDYLQKKIPNFKKEGKLYTCPKCKQVSSNIFPPLSGKLFCYNPECKNIGTIFDICRDIDFYGNKDVSEDDIAQFLIKMFDIKTDHHVDKLLNKYVEWGWDLVPIARDTKIPIEKNWTEKNHKNRNEWEQWLDNNNGIGLKTGSISQVTIIDADLITKEESEIWQKGTALKTIEEIKQKKEDNLKKLKELNIFNNTITQDSGWKGVHFIYKYEKDIPKCSFDHEGIHFDVENDGGYILIEPSTFCGKTRKISGDIIEVMGTDLKNLILSKMVKEKIERPPLTDIQGEGMIQGLDGCCNSRFVQVGGMFRKFMNVRQTEQALNMVNKYMLDDPMDYKSMKAMCNQIEKYYQADINTITNEILNHMSIVQDAHVRDLKECLGYDRKDLEQALKYLCDHKKLYKIKKDLYRLISDTEWQEDFMTLGKPLDFKVPLVSEYANFDNGSMLIFGSPSGFGKTTLSVNFIKDFVEQGITPYLISTEAGSKFHKIAQTVGLKEGDFKYFVTTDPTSVKLEKNAVTILDWLKAPDSDYAKFDSIYEKLNNHLVENGGLLIVLAQLKRENKNFYSEDMTLFFGALVAKLLYEQNNGIIDNSRPYLETIKIRDSKVNKQYITIPLKYDYETKRLNLR